MAAEATATAYIVINPKEKHMTTIKLSEFQHSVLLHAIKYTNGRIEWFPDSLKGIACSNVLDALIRKELVTNKGTHWGVTPKGYQILGKVEPASNTFNSDTKRAVAKGNGGQKKQDAAKLLPKADGETKPQSSESSENSKVGTEAKSHTRKNSKQATVIQMLQRPEGATISQICDATGWQAHTVRGAFAGALKKKLGLFITSQKSEGGERIYRVANSNETAKSATSNKASDKP